MGQISAAQKAVCERFGADPLAAPDHLKVGVGPGSGPPTGQLNGLRHPPEGDTSGWYLWVGELEQSNDFFEPMHISHLPDKYPEAIPYLALPAGWRFLIASGNEDVWYDPSLLDV